MALRTQVGRVVAWWCGEGELTLSRGVLGVGVAVRALALATGVVVALQVTRELREAPPPAMLPSGSENASPLANRFGVPLPVRRQIFATLVHDEPAAQKRAEENFPGEPWSVEDDRAASERDRVRALAASRKLNVTQIYLILDEGLRAHWPGPDGKALPTHVVPLRPRRR